MYNETKFSCEINMAWNKKYKLIFIEVKYFPFWVSDIICVEAVLGYDGYPIFYNVWRLN